MECGGTGDVRALHDIAGRLRSLHMEALAGLQELFGVPESSAILLLQGGATQQFSQVAMNSPRETADYTSPASGRGALGSGQGRHGARGRRQPQEKPARRPSERDQTGSDAAYLHITSNETVDGTQWKEFPMAPIPWWGHELRHHGPRHPVGPICLVSPPGPKNLGPAGVTVVIDARIY